MRSLALLLPALVALQVGVQPALAWAWPVDGPVVRPFVLGDDPYAGGQHRGIDIGSSPGGPVRAPASGSVSFAGTVPTGGKTVTIRTPDGYAVTLQHLGGYSVARGADVAEGETIAAASAAGAEGSATIVYLGIRVADEPNGYVDPLTLLPAPPAPAEDPPPAEPPADPPAEPADSHESDPGAPAHQDPAPSRHHREDSTSGRAPESRDASAPVAEKGDHAASDAWPASPHGRGARLGAPVRAAVPEHSVLPADATAGFVPAVLHEPAQGHRSRLTSLVPAAFAAGLALAGAALVRRRRQLGHAASADGAAAVLLQGAAATAEDADCLRLRQEDHVVLDGDLERVLLGQREPLSNLDRDDDPPQIVDVANDPRSRRSSGRAGLVGALGGSVGPHQSLAFASRRALIVRSPRAGLSNPRRRRNRASTFV
jgi:hypothetical protein